MKPGTQTVLNGRLRISVGLLAKLIWTLLLVVTVTSMSMGQCSSTVISSITQQSDDMEERSDGTIVGSSSDLEMVTESTQQTIGLRFNGITIPKNSTILNAYITFNADEADDVATNLVFHGERTASGTVPTFDTDLNDVSDATNTFASVSWNSIPEWFVNNLYNTPDLSPIIQEIISQDNWVSNNSLAIIVTGSGKRVADSYSGGIPAQLTIEYCQAEICDNNIDDDGDGDIDCADIDCGFIDNREFNNSTEQWGLWENSTTTGTYSIDNTSQLSGLNAAKIEIAGATGTAWHLQLAQTGKSIEAGKYYEVNFDAKAASARTINATVQLSVSPWTSYFYQDVNLTATATSYSFVFFSNVTITNDITFLFNLAQSNETVWIDNVQFKESCCSPLVLTGPSGICIGSTTTVSPTSGGTWTSSNTGVATITNAGVITGVGTGTATFTFDETATGCNTTTNFSVSVSSVTAGASAAGVITCDNPTTTVTATPSGTMTYLWSDGATTQINTVSTGGTYTVTVTDSNGCTDTAEVEVLEDTKPPTITLNNDVVDCGQTITLNPDLCENYPDIWAQRPLATNGWSNIFGEDRSPLTGDGELCFTIDSLFGASPQMLGLNADPFNSNSYTDIDYAMYIYARADINRYLIQIRESGTYKANAYDSSISYEGSTLCVRRTGSLIEYLMDGSVIYTSTIASNVDLFYDHTFYSSTSSIWSTGFSSFTDISLCGEIALSYEWNTGETTETLDVTSPGSYTITVTDAKGCTSSATSVVSAGSNMSISIDFLGSLCLEDNSQLTANITDGVPNYTYSWTGPNSFTSTADTISIVDDGNYYLTVTDSNGCEATTSGFVYARYEPFVFTLDTEICEGENVTLTVNSGSAVAYQWGANAGNATTQGVTVTPSPPSTTYNVTVTNNLGCTTVASSEITVNPKPTVSITGPATICNGETTTLSPTTGGVWSSSNNAVATVSNSGVVTSVGPGTASFIFTESTFGCASDPTNLVTVTPAVNVNIDFIGSVCLEDTTKLVADVSGGTAGFFYSWTGPNGFTASTDTISIIDQGNYYVTVTDAKGCSASTSTFVYDRYEPFIFTLNTTVCEGENVTMSVNSASAVAYQWSANAGGVTTQSATVTPSPPSTIYYVTVTNDLGCTTVADIEITVEPKPTVGFTGPASICAGQTTTLSPSSGGTWVSSNNGVAIVNNSGVVTGVSSGSATFTFTDSSTGCISDPTSIVTVSNNVNLSISGDQNACIGTDKTLSASHNGGTWTSLNTSILTVNSSGIVTPVAAGSTQITYQISGGCYITASHNFEVFDNPTVTISGPTTICKGATTTLTPITGGTWISNNPSIASVNNAGLVTGLAAGDAYFTFTNSTTGCSRQTSSPVTVEVGAPVSLNGPSNICIGETTSLLPSSGGVWSSDNTSIATVNSSGIVTGQSAGTAIFSFIDSSNGCLSENTISITINDLITPTFSGPDELCIGETTTLTPSSGGTYTSSNTAVASITNGGVVTAVASGTATFTFTSALGCISNISSPLTVTSAPVTNLTGPSDICIGQATTITPSSGGTWSSTDVSVASISNSGLITGIGVGTVQFIFTTNTSGCISDSSVVVTVNPPTAISLTGPNAICIGETTTFSPTTGGSWVSNNPAVATISNSGVVTGVSSGAVTFVFTSNTGCPSDDSQYITIKDDPNAHFTGPASMCVGSTTTLSPTTGGTWISSNPSVATVTNSGFVTGIAIGTASFTFTDSSTGCVSTTAGSLIVYDVPVAQITGSNQICSGSTTSMSPVSGGTWSSSDPSIATIANNGVVTGVSPGIATFTFVENGSLCTSDPSAPITIIPRPTISITGDQTICTGETTTLSPTSGGIWTSSDNSVASVSNSGVVTGLAQGLARFTFISNEGCASIPSSPIVILGKPEIFINGPSELCIGSTLNLSPTSGGLWSSNNPSIATITNNGQVTALQAGVVNFTFTDTVSGCTSDPSLDITIDNDPIVSINGTDQICIGTSTYLTPTSGGVWTSSNPSVASVQNNGTVTGLTTGTATFTFMDFTTGCISDPTLPVTVNNLGDPTYVGDSILCLDESTSLLPSSGGTWMSLDPSVASINNSGVVTVHAPGTTRFRFTSSSNGCSTNLSGPLVVNDYPSVGLNGPGLICIGSTSNVYPSTGGIWTSSDPSVASIDNSGLISGLSAGSATFQYTDNVSGCVSQDIIMVTVQSGPVITLTGDAQICIGYNTTLSPTSGGIWFSSNEQIATISNNGTVTGKAPGKVTFQFLDSATGCLSEELPDSIIIEPCLNHDFNVTTEYFELSGNLSTNDNLPSSALYSLDPILISKPIGSNPSLETNADGMYSFSSSVPGKYIYDIEVCIPPTIYGCPKSRLEITVTDDVISINSAVSNPEFITTFTGANPTIPGQAVVLKTLANDDCVITSYCYLDSTSVMILDAPTNGIATVDVDGNITYTPDAGFIGYDTLTYSVCVNGDPGNCSQSSQVITVNDLTAINSIVAADDFIWTMKDITVTGNVLTNDADAEGDNIIITAVGSSASPMTIAGGSYYINSSGDYTFIPDPGFYGPSEIIYTICDTNGEVECRDATIHLLVFDDLKLNLKVYLEGALMDNGGETSASGRPLMRDNLRNSPFTGENYIPTIDPYSNAMGLVDITPHYNHVGSGLAAANRIIADSAGVFSVTGENAIVDWVFVELRSKNDNTQAIATRAALVQRDGDIVDLDGASALSFSGVSQDSFYIMVKHRSHLAVMSDLVANDEEVDFTSASRAVFDFGLHPNGYDYTGLAQNKNLINGYAALWAGDFDSDGRVKFTNPDDDQNILFFEILLYPDNSGSSANFDYGYGYMLGDYNMNSKAKYTNPDDDKNLLFSQLLLYPLNDQFLSNYNYFIEQIPE